jgi:hypothetical protein
MLKVFVLKHYFLIVGGLSCDANGTIVLLRNQNTTIEQTFPGVHISYFKSPYRNETSHSDIKRNEKEVLRRVA